MQPYHRIHLLFLIVVSFSFILIMSSLSFADAEKIFRENSRAVVYVITYDENGAALSQGSGFIVRPNGVIVTNYHVVSKARSIKIKAGVKIFDVDGIISLDKENDIAIIKVNAKQLPTVKLGTLANVDIGEKVYVIGSPKGLENTISDGIVSGKRSISRNTNILQITAPISPGSSGGPVFNKRGEVIGVATFILKETQNLNFAMPVDVFKNKISDKKISEKRSVRIDDYEETPFFWIIRGYDYHSRGLYKEAAESYEVALTKAPVMEFVYSMLGNTYVLLSRYQDAIEICAKGLSMDPKDSGCQYAIGFSYVQLDMPKEAINPLKEATRLEPDNSGFMLQLGRAYDGMRMYTEARASYKEVIRINHDSATAYLLLGNTYLYLANTNSLSEMKASVLEARGCYKEAIRIKPGFALAHYMIGTTYIPFKDRDSALEEYKILKGLDPQKAQELFDMIYK